jgi:hypothetical protein
VPSLKKKAPAGGKGSLGVLGQNKSRPTSIGKSPSSQAAAAFTVTLEPLPNTDGIRALGGLLKIALRRYRLRCVDIRGGER